MQKMNTIGRVSEPFKIELLQTPIRKMQDDEVLIKVKASAICGSDLHIFRGKHPSAPLPITIGHEFSGIVEEVGSAVEIIAVGDRVTVEPNITCGHCEPCLKGQYGYCENINFTYRKGDGSMAKYVIVKGNKVFKLPDHLDFQAGALIEPLSVAMHAVRRAYIELGDTVAVIGAGAIGILVVALCKLAGASEIIISDSSNYRLSLAKEFGATRIVNYHTDDILDQVDILTAGTGVDKSFDCVGGEITFGQAIKSLKKDGLATIIGISETPTINIPIGLFVTREIRVKGAQGYCWDFPISLKMSEQVDLRKLVTHIYKLTELQEAMNTSINRDIDSMKIIIEP